MASVTFHESESYIIEQRGKEIADKVKGCGYELADVFGQKFCEESGLKVYEGGICAFGILEPRPGTEIKKKRYFFGLLEKEEQVPKRAYWLGKLWIEHNNIPAKYDKNWRLDVQGRENVPKLIELAKKISKQYNVSVDVRVESEEAKLETRPDGKDYSIGFSTIMSILCDAEI